MPHTDDLLRLVRAAHSGTPLAQGFASLLTRGRGWNVGDAGLRSLALRTSTELLPILPLPRMSLTIATCNLEDCSDDAL